MAANWSFSETMCGFPVAVVRASWTLCSSSTTADNASPGIGFVDQDCALPHQIAVLLAYDADHSFEKRVAGSDEDGDGLLVDLVLIEADALVAPLDSSAGTNLPVAFANGGWNVGDLPAAFLAPFHASAKMLEGFHEKALDVARLESLRLGALHLEPKFLDRGHRQCIVRQRASFKKPQASGLDPQHRRPFQTTGP